MGLNFFSCTVGSYVKFGRYPQTAEGEVRPVEWLVLYTSLSGAVLISRYGLDAKRFDSESNDWSKSEIYWWLNGEFYYNAFTSDERDLLGSFNDDHVFLLSKEEADEFFGDLANRDAGIFKCFLADKYKQDAMKCKPTEYAKANGAYADYDGYCWWWLRSSYISDCVYHVDEYGGICSYNSVRDDRGCVRPALVIKF